MSPTWIPNRACTLPSHPKRSRNRQRRTGTASPHAVPGRDGCRRSCRRTAAPRLWTYAACRLGSTVVMSSGNSTEGSVMMRAMGLEVILVGQSDGSHAGHVTGDDLALVETVAASIATERSAFRADQFTLSGNAGAHGDGTGAELWSQSDRLVDLFCEFVCEDAWPPPNPLPTTTIAWRVIHLRRLDGHHRSSPSPTRGQTSTTPPCRATSAAGSRGCSACRTTSSRLSPRLATSRCSSRGPPTGRTGSSRATRHNHAARTRPSRRRDRRAA